MNCVKGDDLAAVLQVQQAHDLAHVVAHGHLAQRQHRDPKHNQGQATQEAARDCCDAVSRAILLHGNTVLKSLSMLTNIHGLCAAAVMTSSVLVR